MTREINLNLGPLFEKHAPDLNQHELAKSLGISRATLRAYIENRWTVLDRAVLERLADFLRCDAGSLVETNPSPFFTPFLESAEAGHSPSSHCVYLRRPDANIEQAGRKRAYRDYRAIERIEDLFNTWIDGFASEEYAATTQDDFTAYVAQNSLVVGSPMVNPAYELAICRTFGVTPFEPSVSPKIPFVFKTARSVRPSSVMEASATGRPGIWLRDPNELIEADYWPFEEFKQRRIRKGRDCAVVLVSNYRAGPEGGPMRKLMLIAGLTGTATEGAAMALVDHFRDFEPRGETPTYVWGVVEVFYNKPARSENREILHYHWRRRAGGRCPIDFVKRVHQPVGRHARHSL